MCFFITWVAVMLTIVLGIVSARDLKRERTIETNCCANGHVMRTRFGFVSDLWWRKHDKCFDNFDKPYQRR